LIYRYYRGVKFHPSLFDVQVKQWVNSRIGMMIWQLLILVFYMYSVQYKGDENNTLLVNVLLQTLYIGKFFYWENCYFSTLDITLDRAGFYICWGCLFFVPCLYTSHTFIIATHPSNGNPILIWLLFTVGLVALILNYYTDRQKYKFQKFREVGQMNDNSFIVKKIDHNNNTYTIMANDSWTWLEGTKKDGTISKLLLSGFWSWGRHLNYTFELITALIWSGIAFLTSLKLLYLSCFAYTLFLFILLIHRTGRDDRKCTDKYGDLWLVYKSIVPNNFVPNLKNIY
jgi:7-dehydrocholesterol reductase